MKTTFGLIILISVPLFIVFGQDASFDASVDRNSVALGDQFEISFTLNGSGGGSNFTPPAFDDFLTISGPNQSTSMQFINGAMSATATYSYLLQPRGEGKFVIGPASIRHNNKLLRTRPVTIEVTKGAPRQKDKPGEQQKESDVGKQIGENLFLKVSLDKSRIYQGEQITATYKIYTRVNIVNYNMTRVPSTTGFWSEELEIPKQVQLSTETVGGKQYRVGILKKIALFPQSSGMLKIDPMEIECVVQVQSRRRSNDIFDQFFNDPFFGNVTNVKHKVASQPVSVNVLPLPAGNVPDGFAGAVGKFSMDVWLDKRETVTNEPVILKVKIEGRGNLKLIEAPALSIPPDFDSYDPKISDNVIKRGDQIAGGRIFEYLLIPRHPGEYNIRSFSFTYFDTDRKNYVSLESPEFSVRVGKGSGTAQSYATGISKEDVKLLGEDIRFIKSGNAEIRRRGESFAGSPLFFLLLVSPVFGFAGFFLLLRRREKLYGNIGLIRSRQARKVANRRLNESKRLLQSKKREMFYTEISRALWGYIGDKLGIPPADLSLGFVRSSLESKNVSADTVGKLISTLELCEYARFAPGEESVRMDSVYDDSVGLILKIEEQLR